MPVDELAADRALLDAFRRGEKPALARVFRAYADGIARVVRAGVKVEVDGVPVRVGQDLVEHEVEAIVQQTFVKAFAPKARASYDGVRPYAAWLTTIAKNLVIDRARKMRREARVVVAIEAVVALSASQPDPTWPLEEAALVKLLGELERGLGEPERSIFRLRYRERRTHKETASALGLTEIMVRRRDTQLRHLILARLRGEGFLTHAKVTIGATLLPRKLKEG